MVDTTLNISCDDSCNIAITAPADQLGMDGENWLAAIRYKIEYNGTVGTVQYVLESTFTTQEEAGITVVLGWQGNGIEFPFGQEESQIIHNPLSGAVSWTCVPCGD